MSYQEFKQKRDEIESEIYQGNYRTKKILSSELSRELNAEDFDMLLYFIDEYEELIRKLLLYVKEKDRKGIRGKDWEDVSDITINDQEDDKWLTQFFTLDK